MSKRQTASLVRAMMLVLLGFQTSSFACLWVDGTTLDGSPHRYSPTGSSAGLQQAMDATPKQRLEELRKNYPYAEEKSSGEERAAVEAMLLGNPQAAVSLLLKIERANPGQYSTAVNLGTAYELAGENDNALKWISEGIVRNKDSHYGTEWLHQRILETKIRLAADPQYLASHRIIPLPNEFTAETNVKVDGSEYSVAEIARTIYYQLSERMIFVKPKDPIVADLLFTLAQIEAHTTSVESAFQILEKSRSYGFADPSLLQQTSIKYQSSIARGQSILFRRKLYKYTALILLVVAISSGIYFRFRKKRLFLT